MTPVSNFPHLLAEWHPKNELTPHQVSYGSAKEIRWLCNKGHEWIDTPNHRTNMKVGCPYCSHHKTVPSDSLAATHPELISEWSDKNTLTPHEVSYGSRLKFWWKCIKGHEYETRVNHRVNGSGCPYCAFSRGELAVETYLLNHNIEFLREFKFKNCKGKRSLPFDFCVLPDKKEAGLIEFQGRQHYASIEFFGGDKAFENRQKHDRIKREFCREKGLEFLEIHHLDINEIDCILDRFISTLPPRGFPRGGN